MPLDQHFFRSLVALHDSIAGAKTIENETVREKSVAKRQTRLFNLLNTYLQKIFAEGTRAQITEILKFIKINLTDLQKYQLLVEPRLISLDPGGPEDPDGYQTNALMLCAKYTPALIPSMLSIEMPEIEGKPPYLARMLSQCEHPEGKNVFAFLLVFYLENPNPSHIDLNPLNKILEAINRLDPATKQAIFLQVIDDVNTHQKNGLMLLLDCMHHWGDQVELQKKLELVHQILAMFSGDDAKDALYQLLRHQSSFGQTALLLSFNTDVKITETIVTAIESLDTEQGTEIIDLADQDGATATTLMEGKSSQDHPGLRAHIQAIASCQDDYSELSKIDPEEGGANQLMLAIKNKDLAEIDRILGRMDNLTNEQQIKIFCQQFEFKFRRHEHVSDSILTISNALEFACGTKYYQAVQPLVSFMINKLSKGQQFLILNDLRKKHKANEYGYSTSISFVDIDDTIIRSDDPKTLQAIYSILQIIFNLPRDYKVSKDSKDSKTRKGGTIDMLVESLGDYHSRTPSKDRQFNIVIKLLKQCLEKIPKYSKVIYLLAREVVTYNYAAKCILSSKAIKPYYFQLVSIMIEEAEQLSEQEQADFLDEGTLDVALVHNAKPETILQIVRMMNCCKTELEKEKLVKMLSQTIEGRNTLKQVCDNRERYGKAILPMLALIAQLPSEQQQDLLSTPLKAPGREAVKEPIISQEDILNLISENPEQNAHYLLDLVSLDVPNKGKWLKELLLLADEHCPADSLKIIEHFISNQAIKNLEDYFSKYKNKNSADYRERKAHFDNCLIRLINQFKNPQADFSENLAMAKSELLKFKKANPLSSNTYLTCATELLDLLSLYHDYTTPTSLPDDEGKYPAPREEDYRQEPYAPGVAPVAGAVPIAEAFPFAQAVGSRDNRYVEATATAEEIHDTVPSAPLLQGNNIPVARQVTHRENDVEPPPSHAYPETQVHGRSTNPKANT